ncbi:hypothetical protein [Kitasatospora purpeofusca]|uniref:hypothetical protein n=1 Tax=Kitasatospora purpeofusca TaxID=67352 RepID=UPI003652AADE
MDNGFEEVQECGPWRVRLWWPKGASGGPQQLMIEPGSNATPRDIARGISTTVLRRLSLSEAPPRTAPSPEESELAQLGAASRTTLDSEGVSPTYLALLALTYKRVADNGVAAPIPWLADAIGRRPETVRDQLKRARREGFLTTITGKAGGDLTEKAEQILSASPDCRSIFPSRKDDNGVDCQSS